MRADRSISRRQLLGTLASAAAAVGATPFGARRARAQRKTLRIMQWRHFVPGFDPWFNDRFAREWGDANDTEVIIDNVGFGEIATRARAEIQAQTGHDLIQFVTPQAMHCEHLIDHREIFEECANRYGKPEEFAVRNNFNRKTNTYLGFAPSYQPAVVVYRKDLWDKMHAVPDSWTDVLSGSRQIKLLLDAAAGLSLSPEHNGEQSLRAVMYSSGACEQDADARVSLRSPATLEALSYVKSLYEQAMGPEVLAWDGASNNRFMLSGEGCFTVDSLSIVRASETMDIPFRSDLRIGPMPTGPAARLGSFGFYNYSIWKFAENPDGAKQFLADYVGRSRESFLASRFQNMPSYPSTIPDRVALLDADKTGGVAQYDVLKEVASWTTNVGHLGGMNPAVAEVYEKGIVARMFAEVAAGRLSAEVAMDEAQKAAETVFGRWAQQGWV